MTVKEKRIVPIQKILIISGHFSLLPDKKINLKKINFTMQHFTATCKIEYYFQQPNMRILVMSLTLDMIPVKWCFWWIRFSLVLMAMLIASSVSLSVLRK